MQLDNEKYMLKYKVIKMKLNNGAGKYLLFSMAEILLIVVGILLALQLDNWDKDQENREFEKQYYQNINEQLIEDKIVLQGNLNYGINYLIQFEQAVKIIADDDRLKEDKLAEISLNLKYYSDFRRQSSIFQTLVNSGEIKHIKNNILIQRLQSLESNYVYINRMEELHKDLILNQLLPYVIKSIQIQPLKIMDPELLYNYYFQNMIILTIGLMEETHQLYNETINDIDAILAFFPLSNALHN